MTFSGLNEVMTGKYKDYLLYKMINIYMARKIAKSGLSGPLQPRKWTNAGGT